MTNLQSPLTLACNYEQLVFEYPANFEYDKLLTCLKQDWVSVGKMIHLTAKFMRKYNGLLIVYIACSSLHIISTHPISPHLTIPHLTSRHFTSLHIISSHPTSPHPTLPHLTSPHLTSPYLISPDLTPFTSPHPTSPHLTSPHLNTPHPTSPHLTSPYLNSTHLTSLHLLLYLIIASIASPLIHFTFNSPMSLVL